jgi:predicted Zn-dependent peptidase
MLPTTRPAAAVDPATLVAASSHTKQAAHNRLQWSAMNQIYQKQLPNGMWLIGEPIASAQSLAMSMLFPAGTTQESPDRLGAATMLAEMICRGAGGLDARAHSEALDQLGVDRGAGVQSEHMRLGATMIGSKIDQALPLLMDMVRRPHLDATALEPTRDLCLQAIDALADEPQQRALLELRSQHYPHPLGRSPLGRREDIEAMSLDDVKNFWQYAMVPSQAILSFAGCFDWQKLCDHVVELLGDWAGDPQTPEATTTAQRGYHHIEAQTTQMHIALAYDAVAEPDENSMLQRAACSVLSGGMSGRLFTEVREKRGLCYAVMAAYAGRKEQGTMLSYAGTTTPRAQETLDVLVGELHRVCQGIERDEFDRAIVGMKSRLVMQGESTAARATAIGDDQYILGAARSLDELAAKVDAITLDNLNEFVAANQPGAMTIVTIGPQPLEAPQEAAVSCR